MEKLIKRSQPMLSLAALCIILAAVKASHTILVPFILSIFIAIICQPLVNGLIKRHVPKSIAIFSIIIITLIFGFLIAGLVARSINQFSNYIPAFHQQFETLLLWLNTRLVSVNIKLDTELVSTYFDPNILFSLIPNLLSGLSQVMTNLFLIVLTVIFMLFEANSLSQRLHLAVNDPKQRLEAIDQFLFSVNRYLGLKTLISLITALVIMLMLFFLEANDIFLWGLLVFLFNFIPNIGSIIAAIPAVLSILILQDATTAAIAASGYVLVNTVIGNVVEPKVMGKGLGLSSLVVFLSLIIWGWLLGTVGMLLSVPLTMIVKIGLESSPRFQRFAVLLTDKVKAPS